ncbi:MAG: hypothetical protein QM763_03125 [Agriterribacter sp.]
MAFNLDGLSSIISAATSGASSIITAAKGNTTATSTTFGITPVTSSNGSTSNVMGYAVVGVIILAAFKMFSNRRR